MNNAMAPEADNAAQKAEKRRAGRKAIVWARHLRREAELFAAWVQEQQAEGRQDRLTFGDFVRETGILRQENEHGLGQEP